MCNRKKNWIKYIYSKHQICILIPIQEKLQLVYIKRAPFPQKEGFISVSMDSVVL